MQLSGKDVCLCVCRRMVPEELEKQAFQVTKGGEGGQGLSKLDREMLQHCPPLSSATGKNASLLDFSNSLINFDKVFKVLCKAEFHSQWNGWGKACYKKKCFVLRVTCQATAVGKDVASELAKRPQFQIILEEKKQAPPGSPFSALETNKPARKSRRFGSTTKPQLPSLNSPWKSGHLTPNLLGRKLGVA